MALLSGAYILIRRWGRPLNIIAVCGIIMMLIGTAILSVSLDRKGNFIPTYNGQPGRTPTPAPSSGPTIPGSHGYIFNDDIKFKANTGLDFEQTDSSGQPTVLSPGRTDPADLYIDINDYLRAPAGDIFYASYSTTRDECSQTLAGHKDPQTVNLGSYPASAYCFLTSKGNIGKIVITKKAILGKNPEDYIEATVYVWPK